MSERKSQGKPPEKKPVDDDVYSKLEKTIGYRFENSFLLHLALRHRGLDPDTNNERLEFLGDRVLGLSIARWLYSSFPLEREGKLTRRYSRLVGKEVLARIATEVGLPITTAGGRPRYRLQDSIKADACEALLGAIYIDGGMEDVDKVIRRLWDAEVNLRVSPEKDARTALQEWTQSHKLPLPEYRLIRRRKDDHEPEFTMQVEVVGFGRVSEVGSSKREASRAAADRMLRKVKVRR